MTRETEAQTILKMIQTVDPTNTAKLDEIDARTWCFIERIPYEPCGTIEYTRRIFRDENENLIGPAPSYTRSRDALKAIRPEGWWFECCKICDGTYMAELHDDRGCIDDDEGITVKAWYLKNEELAELHAIIQAIEYERGGTTNP
jgi:hypothetical protein